MTVTFDAESDVDRLNLSLFGGPRTNSTVINQVALNRSPQSSGRTSG